MTKTQTDSEDGSGDLQFTAAQQDFVDKVVGKARVKAREKAQTDAAQAAREAADVAEQAKLKASAEWEKLAAKHEARVKELEPFEAQAKAYVELIDGMLKDKIKALGDTAKKAVAALPESLTAIEKLAWLNANEGLFEAQTTEGPVGSPGRKQKPVGRVDDKPVPPSNFPIRL